MNIFNDFVLKSTIIIISYCINNRNSLKLSSTVVSLNSSHVSRNQYTDVRMISLQYIIRYFDIFTHCISHCKNFQIVYGSAIMGSSLLY